MKHMKLGILMHLMCVAPFLATFGQLPLNQYNVIWESPSVDRSGQMPIGNGDIAAGVYAIEDGALYLLLAKNDALTYNGDIFKTGRVKINLEPNPFVKGKSFKQTLDLKTGSILIEAEDVTIRVWADANKPVYHVQINASNMLEVSAASNPWKRVDGCGHNRTSEPLDTPTQDVVLAQNGYILSYFSVGDRSVYPTELKFYEIEHMAAEYPDPYRFNTFGNLIQSPNLQLEGDILKGTGKKFDIRIHAKATQEPELEKWIREIEAQANLPLNISNDWKSHCAWWDAFWYRSWIVVNDNTIPKEDRNGLDHEAYKPSREVKDTGAMVGQSYNVFRYLMACQSRGRIQTKFNGGLFSQPFRRQNGRFSHEDDRLWGRRFTHQNQRLLYWPLFMSGDIDLTKPFFDFYASLLPMRRAVCKAWFGHEGAYFRENMELTGGERDCGPSGDKDSRIDDKPRKTASGANTKGAWYHAYYFTAGLEALTMMIEYTKFSEDAAFRKETLLPFAREILFFYDKHYSRDENGKLRMDPSQALETWWAAINPANDIAGLQFNLDALLTMEVGTKVDQDTWQRFRAEIPEVPMREIEGRMAIAPAETWKRKKNTEIPELYPLFPFTLYSAALGSKNIAEWTMEHRLIKNAQGYKCWTQDQIGFAYSGNAEKARDGLVHRFTHTSPLCRFPLYGSHSPDACPDFDHFGAGAVALQRMLMQEANGKIHLLSAWPLEWDADFKLHASKKTTVQGRIRNGKIVKLMVDPMERKKDVIIQKR